GSHWCPAGWLPTAEAPARASLPPAFFFQAEDGIRDRSWLEFRRVLFRSRFFWRTGCVSCRVWHLDPAEPQPLTQPVRRTTAGRRSEERRVGKSVNFWGRRIL